MLQHQRKRLYVFCPFLLAKALPICLYYVLERVFELCWRIVKLNESFAEVREGVCDADGIVGDHGAETLECLDFLITNANIAKSQAPGFDDPREAKGSFLRV